VDWCIRDPRSKTSYATAIAGFLASTSTTMHAAVYTRGCVYIHSIVSLLINGGSFSKEDENILKKKSARMVPVIPQFHMEPREPIFGKCSHLRKKRGGADAFPMF
jgi:hypothetical protein